MFAQSTAPNPAAAASNTPIAPAKAPAAQSPAGIAPIAQDPAVKGPAVKSDAVKSPATQNPAPTSPTVPVSTINPAAQSTAAKSTIDSAHAQAHDLQMQSAQSQAERVRAAMQGSLEKQRASVRLQAKSAGAASMPWDDGLTSTISFSPQTFCEAISQPEMVRMIDGVASRQNIDPTLVREVARQESGFRPCAVSPKGAQGLMQLMPSTQMQLQVQNPFDAQESLEAGSKLLKQLLDRYNGDIKLALSAYNAGPYRVDKAGGVPEIPETKNYVTSIIDRLDQ